MTDLSLLIPCRAARISHVDESVRKISIGEAIIIDRLRVSIERMDACWINATLRNTVTQIHFAFPFFSQRADEITARVGYSLAYSASISAIGNVPAHSTRHQLLLSGHLARDNGHVEGGKSSGGKTTGIRRALHYRTDKCRAQSPVKITRSLISGRGERGAGRSRSKKISSSREEGWQDVDRLSSKGLLGFCSLLAY